MTKEEYTKIAREIGERYTDEATELNKRYALENADYKVGDIIEDRIGKGRIIKIIPPITDNLNNPWEDLSLFYVVDNLTKKGEINRREPPRLINSRNIKSDNTD